MQVKNAYASVQSDQLEMPQTLAKVDAITIAEGDYDLLTEMALDLALKPNFLGWTSVSESQSGTYPTAPNSLKKVKRKATTIAPSNPSQIDSLKSISLQNSSHYGDSFADEYVSFFSKRI